MLAWVALRRSELEVAGRLADEARVLAAEKRIPELELEPLHLQALTARLSGDLELARGLFHESIALSHFLEDSAALPTEYCNLGYVEFYRGDFGTARLLFAMGLTTAARARDLRVLAKIALSVAVIAEADGDLEQAVGLLAAADGAWATQGQVPGPDDVIERNRLYQKLERGVDGKAFEDAYFLGMGVDVHQALAGWTPRRLNLS
jgi:hypothetical protein